MYFYTAVIVVISIEKRFGEVFRRGLEEPYSIPDSPFGNHYYVRLRMSYNGHAISIFYRNVMVIIYGVFSTVFYRNRRGYTTRSYRINTFYQHPRMYHTYFYRLVRTQYNVYRNYKRTDFDANSIFF